MSDIFVFLAEWIENKCYTSERTLYTSLKQGLTLFLFGLISSCLFQWFSLGKEFAFSAKNKTFTLTLYKSTSKFFNSIYPLAVAKTVFLTLNLPKVANAPVNEGGKGERRKKGGKKGEKGEREEE